MGQVHIYIAHEHTYLRNAFTVSVGPGHPCPPLLICFLTEPVVLVLIYTASLLSTV